MQITLSKKTASKLKKAIWLTIGTCNKTRNESQFTPNEEIMKHLGVSTEDLYRLQQLSDQIDKKLKSNTTN